MTKSQVVAYLAEEVGITKKQGAAVLDALAGLAVKIIKKGDKLALPGFVTVKVQNRKARIGRNPQTGEPLKIPAKKVVKAVPAAALKGILGAKKK
ncbi:MAG TPA: HU family DNA-binding protein [Thermodesulfobacteriota bacterium]|jgi:DNA-binding protein HU-beta|nr:HU family DNA-binding protein [Thermodesulfobacteriota bacterium]